MDKLQERFKKLLAQFLMREHLMESLVLVLNKEQHMDLIL